MIKTFLKKENVFATNEHIFSKTHNTAKWTMSDES